MIVMKENNVVCVGSMLDDIVFGMGTVGEIGCRAERVCLFPYGCSLVSADIMSRCADRLSSIPVWMSDDGRLPGWISKGSDAIIISYGMDKGAVHCCRLLVSRGCRVHVITSSLELSYTVSNLGGDAIVIPDGRSPRDAIGFEIGALVALLDALGLPAFRGEIESSMPFLREAIGAIGPDASALSEAIRESRVAVYGTAEHCAVARRWKVDIEESTKRPSFHGELPEFDHNEIVGWSDTGVQSKDLATVVFTGGFTSDMQEYIVRSMIEVLRENSRTVIEVPLKGGCPMERNIYGILLGDSVAAMIRGCEQ